MEAVVVYFKAIFQNYLGKGRGKPGKILVVQFAYENIHVKSISLKWDEVTGEWRKLHNEELRDLYSSSSIIRMINYRRDM
jgi:hypothetical protein